MSQDVLKAIDSLPIDFRMVVILADLQEFAYKDILRFSTYPVGTVMSQFVSRSQKQLQKLILAKEGRAAWVPIGFERVPRTKEARMKTAPP